MEKRKLAPGFKESISPGMDAQFKPNRDALGAFAAEVYDSRRRRNAIFGSGLFGEPDWDILLDLYINMTRGRIVSAKGVCIASHASDSTALRYIEVLHGRGLIIKHHDEVDKQLAFLTLSEEGIGKIETYLLEFGNLHRVISPITHFLNDRG